MTSEFTLIKEPIGIVWINFKKIDSTNKKAHSLALQGVKEGTVVTADIQTKGKGRRGNLWHSPEGGLYCSIILRPKIMLKDTVLFERLVGIAVWETVSHFVPKIPKIKVPNDVLIKGKKVAGILIEAKGRKDKLIHLVIGIGINCQGNLDSFPSDLKFKVTTISQEAERFVTPSEILDVLLTFLNKWYNIFLSGEIIQISNQWEKLLKE